MGNVPFITSKTTTGALPERQRYYDLSRYSSDLSSGGVHLWDAQNLTIVALEFLAQESFKGKVVDECLHTSYSTVILYRHTLNVIVIL